MNIQADAIKTQLIVQSNKFKYGLSYATIYEIALSLMTEVEKSKEIYGEDKKAIVLDVVDHIISHDTTMTVKEQLDLKITVNKFLPSAIDFIIFLSKDRGILKKFGKKLNILKCCQ